MVEGKVEMKMTCDSLCNRHFWEERGITLPSYDVEAVYKKTKQTPGKYPRKAGLPAKEPLK